MAVVRPKNANTSHFIILAPEPRYRRGQGRVIFYSEMSLLRYVVRYQNPAPVSGMPLETGVLHISQVLGRFLRDLRGPYRRSMPGLESRGLVVRDLGRAGRREMLCKPVYICCSIGVFFPTCPRRDTLTWALLRHQRRLTGVTMPSRISKQCIRSIPRTFSEHS